jgi:alpha-beta hydrolase superfamily lysophospholipase
VVREVVELELRTADDVALRAVSHRSGAGTDRPIVVVVHGFSAGVDDPGITRLVDDLFDDGCDVLVYDARGHGSSGGVSAVGSAEHLDVASAVAVAASWDAPVVVVGVSMGAVAVAQFLADHDAPSVPCVAGGVLVSGPARWRMTPSPVGLLTAVMTKTAPGRAVAVRLLKVRISPRWRTGEPPEDLVAKIERPLAVVHGAGDRLLSPVHAHRLRDSAGGPSRLDLVAGMGHGLGGSGVPEVTEAVRWVTTTATSTQIGSSHSP